MTQKNRRTDKKAEKEGYIQDNFRNKDTFFKKVFEIRFATPKEITAKLKLPSNLWGERGIRNLREEAIENEMLLMLRENGKLTFDELWDKLNLSKVPGARKCAHTEKKRGYDEIFDRAKKRAEKATG